MSDVAKFIRLYETDFGKCALKKEAGYILKRA